jgi:hypothetical protein
MQDWVVKIEQVAKSAKRAKEEEASSSSVTDAPTPSGPGDLTPQRTISRPIPISSPSQRPEGATLGSSYMSSALSTTSATSELEMAPSSSYTSQYSIPSTYSSVPPNSLAVPNAFPSQPVDVDKVDKRLSGLQIDVPSSYTSSTNSNPKPSIAHRPSSPNIASSSEDEDEPPSPMSPTHPSASQRPLQLPNKDKVILSGYLTKQGKRKNWRKRWFTLTSTSLSYSKSHMVRDRPISPSSYWTL